MDLLFMLLAYVVTVIGRIRMAWWWVWRVLFLLFPTLFLPIAFLFNQFNVIAILQQIRFIRWWVWRWYVWIRVYWYVRFSILLWQFRCLCQWRRVWIFVLTGIDSIGDVVPLFVFVPIGVESKGGRLIGVESKCGQLIESFWRPKSWSTTLSLLVSQTLFKL